MSTDDQTSSDDHVSPLPELTFGRRIASNPSITLPERWISPADDNPEKLIERCQLKAEACRWAIRRRQLLTERADFQREIAPRDRAMVAKAKDLGNCFLWMCSADSPNPTDTRLYDDLSNAFEAVAAGLLLLNDRQKQRGSADLKQPLLLLAEAQLVLREAIHSVGGPVDDDQVRSFNLVKQMAEADHIHLVHHMRINDTADPRSGARLWSQLKLLRRQRQDAIEKELQLQPLIDQLQDKLTVLSNDPSSSELWKDAISRVEQLIEAGVPPSHRQLRELIVPLIEAIPESTVISPGFELALREADRHLAEASMPATQESTEPTAEIKAVASLLHGRTIVLVGGDRRPHSESAIKAAFQLKDLIWISTRSHESIKGFEPPIMNSDVALVLLAIRWASHSFGEIKMFCDRVGKPLVRLPGGYNPQQVAVQILRQASEVLGAVRHTLERT